MTHRPDFIRIGTAIRGRREGMKHTQESFADHIEMQRTYYSAIERGEKNLMLETLNKVCNGLKVKMSEVLKESGE